MGNIKETFLNPIFKGNPISVLVLGICSSLAVTVQLKGAFVMGLSVMIVTGLSSLICSLLRNTIPNRIRIIVQLVVVALEYRIQKCFLNVSHNTIPPLCFLVQLLQQPLLLQLPRKSGRSSILQRSSRNSSGRNRTTGQVFFQEPEM